jgi:hypothetical protein
MGQRVWVCVNLGMATSQHEGAYGAQGVDWQEFARGVLGLDSRWSVLDLRLHIADDVISLERERLFCEWILAFALSVMSDDSRV